MKLSEMDPRKIEEMKEELRVLDAKKGKEAPIVIQENDSSEKESHKVCEFCGGLFNEGQLFCNNC